MTDTARSVKENVKENVKDKASGGLGSLARSPAVDRLKSELQDYVGAQAQSLLGGVGRRLGRGTALLNDVAEGKSPGLGKLALQGGKKLAEGKNPLRTVAEVGGGQLKDKAEGAVKSLTGQGRQEGEDADGGGGGKGRSGARPTVVMESVDVGVPLRTAYDQWTQYQEFSTFAKGVQSVERDDDNTSSDWQTKIFLSSRQFQAETTEQVPDDRISWDSEGSKGSTKGVVSFHELGPELTRVLLVMEYYPQGFVEKTANLWRAQGRRARLDLKNFARFITIRGEASDAWRGEIREGEVVLSHDDAVAEEERDDQDDQGGPDDGVPGESDPEGHDEYEDEANAGYEDAEPDEADGDVEADGQETRGS